MHKTTLREVSYDEWESVVNSVGDLLQKYGTAYKNSEGNYSLDQSWSGKPIISLLIIDLELTNTIISDIIKTLKTFQPDWRIWVTYCDEHLRWENHDSIAITNKEWYPVDRTCRRVW